MTAIRDAFIDANPTVALQRRLLADLAAVDAVASDEPQAIVCWAGDRRYAIPTRDVQQVALVPTVVDVPGVAAHIRGVAAVAGDVFEVLDIARLEGNASATNAASPDARLICVAPTRAILLALLVERVEPFVSLASLGALRREGNEPPWVSGRNAALLTMLDPSNLRAV